MTYLPIGFGANYRVMTMEAGFRRLEVDHVVQGYRNARACRVFLVDNEGTLAPDTRVSCLIF